MGSAGERHVRHGTDDRRIRQFPAPRFPVSGNRGYGSGRDRCRDLAADRFYEPRSGCQKPVDRLPRSDRGGCRVADHRQMGGQTGLHLAPLSRDEKKERKKKKKINIIREKKKKKKKKKKS